MTLLDLSARDREGKAATAVRPVWDSEPLRYLDEHGAPVEGGIRPTPALLDPGALLRGYRALRFARAFDTEATNLVMQGRLAVYPSCRGQEACEVAAVHALEEQDWLLPTYRDSAALVLRGIPAVDALTLLRGTWHCGYDPKQWRTMPQCTPLATQGPHAVGLGLAAKLAGDPAVALCFFGDGATSEGDFHEAANSAAVYQAPVVFLVQNNQYAISVPLHKQTHAISLADKASGYGMPGIRVDGNDLIAMNAVLAEAVQRARTGGGPTLIEAVTYRVQAHTNADDAARYRQSAEVEYWRRRDPIDRLGRYLTARGALDAAVEAEIDEECERYCEQMRAQFAEEPSYDADEMFEHVYDEMTPQLKAQREMLRAEEAAK
ncbi:pyruvate dehydrogenase (acetyl-transferring) E1 component subunit alpha [Actinospica sp. MGRD01-02]|uniref:Pyruvate dehydrogenase (Acetyl-transferring) E1 component subunit alpha n=1 Tax=Actinospica acidithermotolerans TaxID=2828514 RepID=A0A941IJT4_9ACTN|nr:pyruvate dehydrogenase (acetyl-transferring) E1 component subunit alpha [Actinospica acidithermotolerans]MBR7826031.1 pyruvate dehydrogenase (acetyl-transferring) E1 component subunit alpha [Actinospica acidithermotolerans]